MGLLNAPKSLAFKKQQKKNATDDISFSWSYSKVYQHNIKNKIILLSTSQYCIKKNLGYRDKRKTLHLFFVFILEPLFF